jgi:phage terminase large subunit-like protein
MAEAAAPIWSTACPDWEHRIRNGMSIIPAPIFPEEAEAGLAVFRDLRLADVAGEPAIGEVCAQWVFDLAASIFGAYDADSGRRLIRTWFVLVPKKNTKSTIAAAAMLTAAIRNWRSSARLTILAPTLEVANNSFDPCSDMVLHDEELEDIFQVQTHIKTVTHRENGTTLKVVAADSNTVGGSKSGFILVDELWLFGKKPDARKMLTEATGGMTSRPEGFVIYLTTQSDEPPAGVFKEKLDYARDVRDGKIVDPTFQPILYEFPADMVESKAYLKPENFPLVNPNWGYSVDPAFMLEKFQEAERTGEGAVREWVAKHLNVEIGLNLRSDRWAGAAFWLDAASPGGLTLKALLARCEVVVVGVDGGGLDDLLGLAVAGRERGTGKWLLWTHAWAHKIVLEIRKDIAERLLDFQRDGDLTIVEKPGDDVEQVADIVCQVRTAGLLPAEKAIGVDRAGIGAIVKTLTSEARGITADQIIAIPQGWPLNGAIKDTERQVAGGQLLHGGTALMNWCVGNARIVQQGNAISITKQASGTAKIDPLMATFDAVSLLSLNPAPPNPEPSARWI